VRLWISDRCSVKVNRNLPKSAIADHCDELGLKLMAAKNRIKRQAEIIEKLLIEKDANQTSEIKSQ